MSNADKTPVDGRTTLEMVLEKLGEVGTDAKLAVAEARSAGAAAEEAKGHSLKTYNLQLKLNEQNKALTHRVRALELTRLWLPLAAIVLAGLALLKSW